MVKAIVTDIEGTTSSISFVHDVLFPYAARQLPAFVRQNQARIEVATALQDAAKVADIDETETEELITQFLAWIAEDRKITPLKTLQGLIWEQGYRNGDYQAHVYPDAAQALQQWHQQGLPLYVYSSGSVYAQKLFFEFSEAGNLLPLFSGHFDTTTGPKREATSYRAIVHALEIPAGEVLFLSDIREELDAAHEAGMRTVWVQRDGEVQAHSQHQCVTDFSAIVVD